MNPTFLGKLFLVSALVSSGPLWANPNTPFASAKYGCAVTQVREFLHENYTYNERFKVEYTTEVSSSEISITVRRKASLGETLASIVGMGPDSRTIMDYKVFDTADFLETKTLLTHDENGWEYVKPVEVDEMINVSSEDFKAETSQMTTSAFAEFDMEKLKAFSFNKEAYANCLISRRKEFYRLEYKSRFKVQGETLRAISYGTGEGDIALLAGRGPKTARDNSEKRAIEDAQRKAVSLCEHVTGEICVPEHTSIVGRSEHKDKKWATARAIAKPLK